MTRATATILGCGNSTGVPAIGNVWGVCDPDEPKNRRSRSSLIIQSKKTSLLIDTGPDFRDQINREGFSDVDAVLYTHAHSDHISGIDELRVLSLRKKSLIPIYADRDTLDTLQVNYAYLFGQGDTRYYPTIIEPHILKDFGQNHTIGDLNFVPFLQDHHTCQSVGYRFGSFAYSLDFKNIDDKALQILRGVKSWVVDCAAYKNNDNPIHASLDTIFRLNKTVGAEMVYLSSLTLTMDYQTLCRELPEGYAPAHDGLRIEIEEYIT